jgi:hypothetical protein
MLAPRIPGGGNPGEAAASAAHVLRRGGFFSAPASAACCAHPGKVIDRLSGEHAPLDGQGAGTFSRPPDAAPARKVRLAQGDVVGTPV